MKESIKFSILVPVYNVMDYIDECIQSVLSQTYTNYELVLVDDGSTDKSGIIIDEYAIRFEQIKTFHKENGGQFHTRRFAIEHATGEYFVMLDSDDMLEKNCLEVLYKSIIKHNCDCVFFNRKRLINGNIIHATHHNKEEYVVGKNQIIKKVLIDIPYNSLCLKCAKSNMYTNKDYTQYYHIRKGEDALQSLELLSNCNTAEFIDDELYIYRKRLGSISNPIDQTDYEIDLTVREICLQFVREHDCFNEKEMNDYRDKYILYYINHIIFIGLLNLSMKEKKGKYEQLREEKYYTEFLCKGITDKKKIGHKAIIWYLFTHQYDYLLIKLMQIYKLICYQYK